MTRIEYLKKVILESTLLENKSWYVTTFGIPMKIYTDTSWNTLDRFSIVRTADTLNYVDLSVEEDGNKLVPITDSKKDVPLFTFQELIDIDSSWLPSVSGKITTKLGNLIINKIVIYPSFGSKLGYLNTAIKTDDLENLIASKLKNDDEAKATDITVKELNTFVSKLYFLTNLADLTSVTATPKTITSPTGLKKLKSELFAKHKDELNNPVKLVEFEDKLKTLDIEYLKDDPTFGKVTSAKSLKARKKLFLIFGTEIGFDKTVEAKPIISSLNEGLETSEENFPIYMNGLRHGSFARGNETILGGVTFKVLQRSLSNLSIVNPDCGTKKGLSKLITDKTFDKLVTRNIKLNGKWSTVVDVVEAKKYVGKTIEIRSPMYCLTEGNSLCYHCMSELLKDQSGGVSVMAAEVSGVILDMFMSLMHGFQITVTEIDMKDLVT